VITDGGAGRLESVTDRNELDEFLCNALLADRTFEAERERNIVILDTPDSVQEVGAPPPSTVEDVKEEMIKFAHEHLSIPRRYAAVLPHSQSTIVQATVVHNISIVFIGNITSRAQTGLDGPRI